MDKIIKIIIGVIFGLIISQKEIKRLFENNK